MLHFSLPSRVISHRYSPQKAYSGTLKSPFEKIKIIQTSGISSPNFIFGGCYPVKLVSIQTSLNRKNAIVFSAAFPKHVQVQLPDLNRLQGKTFDVQLAMKRLVSETTKFSPPILRSTYKNGWFFEVERFSSKNFSGKFRV